MKKAIEKAIENGFDVTQFTQYDISDYIGVKEQPSNYFLQFDFSDGRVSDISVYAFIFGTDFIGKLVGEVDGSCIAERADLMGGCCDNSRTCKRCSFWKNNTADYHRAKMCNLKDVDAIKAYINTNIMGGEG